MSFNQPNVTFFIKGSWSSSFISSSWLESFPISLHPLVNLFFAFFHDIRLIGKTFQIYLRHVVQPLLILEIFDYFFLSKILVWADTFDNRGINTEIGLVTAWSFFDPSFVFLLERPFVITTPWSLWVIFLPHSIGLQSWEWPTKMFVP